MIIALFVHDLFLEIGHSHAMIEVIRNIPSESITHLHLVSYTTASPEQLFPGLKGRVTFHKVPFSRPRPFILKAIFYQIYTYFWSLFCLPAKSVQIGIGIASLHVNLVNVQFVHEQWAQYFFKQRRLPLITYIYKKILFYYYQICENILYSRKNIQVISLSQFVATFLEGKYHLGERLQVSYSGVNLQRFGSKLYTKEEAYNYLLTKYSLLQHLDLKRPIYLFVGAYERKGLPLVIEKLSKKNEAQLIIIGKSESGNKMIFPSNLKTFCIDFTSELVYFYSLADHFVFPTQYEPFGLVLIEASAMGPIVHTLRENVGASEILENLPEIHIYNDRSCFEINSEKILTHQEKQELQSKRLVHLKQYSWDKTAQDFLMVLNKINYSV